MFLSLCHIDHLHVNRLCACLLGICQEENVSTTIFFGKCLVIFSIKWLNMHPICKVCGNDIIYSNFHIYPKKIIQKNGEKSFYSLKINFFRPCPSISTSTYTESHKWATWTRTRKILNVLYIYLKDFKGGRKLSLNSNQYFFHGIPKLSR